MIYDHFTMLPERAFQSVGGRMTLEGGKGAPAAPDYSGAAAQDRAANKEMLAGQTWANRPTMNTPWGQQSWESSKQIDPATGLPVTAWESNITLSGDQQKSLDDQMAIQAGRSEAAKGLLGQATAAFDKPFDYEGAPAAGTMAGYNPEGARNRAENALFQRQMSKIEPGLTQAEDSRRARMAAMGIPLEGGSQAFERAQSGMDSARQRAYQDAAYQSVIGGGQEASRELALTSGAAGEMDRQRQQYLAEEAQRRGMPLNELNALLTGQQVAMPQMPGQPNSTAGQGVPSNALAAANMQGQFDTANKEEGMDWGSMIGTAAGAMMMSDRRLKKNIQRLGGRWYTFEYKAAPGVRHVGVMAQEVMHTHPDAVEVRPDGFLMVDYARI